MSEYNRTFHENSVVALRSTYVFEYQKPLAPHGNMRRYLEKMKIWRLLADQSGATAIEYALMASLIAVAVISSVGLVATRTKDTFNNAGAAINPILGK